MPDTFKFPLSLEAITEKTINFTIYRTKYFSIRRPMHFTIHKAIYFSKLTQAIHQDSLVTDELTFFIFISLILSRKLYSRLITMRTVYQISSGQPFGKHKRLNKINDLVSCQTQYSSLFHPKHTHHLHKSKLFRELRLMFTSSGPLDVIFGVKQAGILYSRSYIDASASASCLRRAIASLAFGLHFSNARNV